MELRDIMLPSDIGKFQKLQKSFIFSVRANAKRRGKWVTGRSASLLQGDVRLNGNNLLFDFRNGTGSDQENAQFAQLEGGRMAGPTPRNFVDIILQWSRDKRLTFADEKERKKFASAVAWKIHEEGTKEHREGTRQDVFTSLYNRFKRDVDLYVNRFLEELSEREMANIENNFNKNILR